MAAATGHIPQNFNAGRWSSWRALWVSAGGSLADASLGIAMRVPGLFIIDYWWQFERTRALPQTLENTAVMQALLNNVGKCLKNGIMPEASKSDSLDKRWRK